MSTVFPLDLYLGEVRHLVAPALVLALVAGLVVTGQQEDLRRLGRGAPPRVFIGARRAKLTAIFVWLPVIVTAIYISSGLMMAFMDSAQLIDIHAHPWQGIFFPGDALFNNYSGLASDMFAMPSLVGLSAFACSYIEIRAARRRHDARDPEQYHPVIVDSIVRSNVWGGVAMLAFGWFWLLRTVPP